MSTRLFDIQQQLGVMFTAAVPDTTVFVGPRPRSGAAPRQFVLVGADGGDTGRNDGLSDDGLAVDQTPSTLGNDWLDETGAIRCSAWSWSGSASFAELRADVEAMHTACAAAVRADRELAGVLGDTGLAHMAAIAVRETSSAEGSYVRAVFVVAYTALITT